MGITRRRLLLGGLGLGVVGAGTGVAMVTDVLPGGPPLRRVVGLTGPDGTVPDVPAGPVTVERVHSAARGRDIDLVIMKPDGTGTAGLPVCLMLHGRGGNARGFIDFGIPKLLTSAVRNGVPPFAIAAVDCGERYYMPHDGDDPLRMLLDEVPGWLSKRGLAETSLAALGFSMGGFGALCLARRRPGLRAAAVASAALFRRWPDAKTRNAFADERQWAENEPLRHLDTINGVPLGVWCGTEDTFIESARELVDKAHPEVAAITRGEHTGGYWLRVLPDMFAFVSKHLHSEL